MIETPRLLLRQWTKSDYPPFAELNRSKVVMEHFPGILSSEESDLLAERARDHIDAHGWGLWAVEVKNGSRFIGFVGLNSVHFQIPFHDRPVEVGWRLSETSWGHGYATEAAHASLEYAWSTLDLNIVVSFTAVSNQRSIRVMEKIGMTSRGEFDHPKIAPGHPLNRHVLYDIANPERG